VTELKSRQADPKFWYEKDSQVTIFHEILNSDLPEKEKSFDRLWQDGTVTVIAGTLTTAAALAEITFHLLRQPEDLRKLKEELATVIPDSGVLPATSKLEQLPYLTAIIKEGLRISNGISTRLQRIATHETLVYTDKTNDKKTKQYLLPPGIPLSCTGMLIHLSPLYFPEPMLFNPQRWIENPGLDKYLVPFSRGTRQCVGINLAYSEIYLTLARVFSSYGSRDVRFEGDKGWLELFETSYRDIEIVGDGVTPLYREGSNGVRIRVCRNNPEE